MTPEEQAAEDERARQAALRSFATIEPAVDDAAGVHRVEMPEEPMRITPGDYGDEPTDSAAPQHEVDQEPGVSQAVDYGEAGMRQMSDMLAQPAAPAELARDDAELLGDVARTGPQRGQMFAPSGARETSEQRFARLGVGGGFSPQIPGDPGAIVRARLAPSSSAGALPVSPSPVDAAPTSTPAAKPAPDPAREAEAGPLPTIDQGLPTEADIAGAREGIGDSILRHLQNGLRGAIGQSTQAAPTRADDIAEERRQGIREALQRKGMMRGQEQQQEATSARQAVQDALAERRVAAAEAMVPQRQEQIAAQTEQTRAQTEHTRLTSEELRGEVGYNAATREQREDPASSASDGMRRAVEARLALLGPREATEREAIGPLEQLNANQLHDILPTLMQGVGIRTSGAGGGGGSTGTPRADTRIAEAVRLGMFDDADTARAHLSAVGPDNFDRELVSRQNEMTAGESAASRSRMPLTEGERGEEVFPGLHAGIRLGTGEARAIRHDIGAVAGRMSSLGRMRQIGEEFGWSGAISPEAAARVRPRLMALRSMAAQIQGTGVINPSEVETINASLPDPTDLEQMTFGTLRAALDEWQGMLEDTVRGNVGETGIGLQEGPDALIRRLRAAADRGEPSSAPSGRASSSSGAAPEGGTVRMRRPDGSIAPNVPAAAVERALARGWEQL